MKNNLSYVKTLLTSSNSKVNTGYWDTVLDLYDHKKYKEALVGVIKYANPSLIEKYGDASKSSFSIPHGSAVVNVTINDDKVHINAPFLEIPDQNKIPLLRRVAEINFTPLRLANIKLQNNQLIFGYSCDLDECEPYKMYDVFNDICIYADSYDDEFIEKFKAKWITKPIITKYDTSKAEIIWNQIQEYISEAQAYIKHFESKQTLDFCWDILVITLMKIDNYCSPEGNVKNEFEKHINYLMKSEDQLFVKNNKGKTFLDEMKNYDKEKFINDLYDTEVFIPPKRRLNYNQLVEVLKSTYERARKEINNDNFTGATLSIQYIFFYVLYYYNIENTYSQPINKSLENASGKTWYEASNILWKTIDALFNNTIENSTHLKKRKGFFSSLFGRN